MSKLAHSNQETMDELDRRRAIENGDEDLIPAQTANAPHSEITVELNSLKIAFTEAMKVADKFQAINKRLIGALDEILYEEVFLIAVNQIDLPAARMKEIIGEIYEKAQKALVEAEVH